MRFIFNNLKTIKKVYKVFYVVLLFILCTPVYISAQISAIGASDSVYTQYRKKNSVNNYIYIFNAAGENIETTYGNLIVNMPNIGVMNANKIIADSIAKNSWKTTDSIKILDSITWKKYRYNNNTRKGDFDSIINKTAGKVSSIEGLKNYIDPNYASGYQATVKKVIINYTILETVKVVDTIFRAWVYINKLKLSIKKDKLGYELRNLLDPPCELTIKFKDKIPSQIIHRDLQSHFEVYIEKKDSFSWEVFSLKNGETQWQREDKADKPISIEVDKWVVSKPPTKYSEYKYVVTMLSKGKQLTDTVKYIPRTTKAKFSLALPVLYTHNKEFKVEPEKELENDTSKDDGNIPQREAPLHYRVKNNSENGDRFTWTLMDTSFVNGDSIPIITTDTAEVISDSDKMVFYYPRLYKIRLVSENIKNACTDTAIKKIIIKQSTFPVRENFPKVFTPDGVNRFPITGEIKDINKYFLPSKADSVISIKSLRLKIVNRWGKEMYDEVYHNLDETWAGWDGMNGFSLAAPGCYWYFYEVEGWGPLNAAAKTGNLNETPSRKGTGSGFFYLFHK